MRSYLKQNRQQIEKDLAHTRHWQFFSPAIYCQYRVMLPLAKEFVHGQLIDLGCGEMPYRQALMPQLESYDGLDLFPRSNEVRYQSDLENMAGVPNESYDSALMIEVLEHLPHPWLALAETNRILRPGGILVLSVPHISRLHDEPHDYYRYTRHGLTRLLQDAGFEVVRLEKKGGVFSFLGHQASTLLVTPTWRIPVLKWVIFFLNSWLITRPAYFLDRWLDRGGIAPLGYVAVARKA